MSLIDIADLSFTHEGSYDAVFEHVSFQIDTDWKLGFTGRNGRGKTTFLKLLMGEYEYEGHISADVDFAYFPCEVPDERVNTAEVVETIHPAVLGWELKRELSLLEVSEDVLYRPFDTLSNGERTKVLLAAFFLKENNFPLIDEPTNHLDREGREIIGQYLNAKRGFILVSHDRAFLDNCVDHILSVNKTDIEIQRGNFSSWLLNKERRDNFERLENERLKKEISRLSAAAKRTSHWSDAVEKTKYGTRNSGLRVDRGFVGHKAAKMMTRSKAIETRRQAATEEKSELLKNVESAEKLKLSALRYPAGRLADLEGVSLFYGAKAVCHDVSFAIENGDRIALCGRNGAGKSSLMKLIGGEDIEYAGRFHRGSQLVISHVPQDTALLSGGLTEYARRYGIDESLFKAILRKLDFSRTQFEKDMRDFSAGQKKKTLLARSLCERAHLYLWDEPLNFVDVMSRMQIEELLMDYAPTILFVEHDGAFCDGIATKKVCLG